MSKLSLTKPYSYLCSGKLSKQDIYENVNARAISPRPLPHAFQRPSLSRHQGPMGDTVQHPSQLHLPATYSRAVQTLSKVILGHPIPTTHVKQNALARSPREQLVVDEIPSVNQKSRLELVRLFLQIFTHPFFSALQLHCAWYVPPTEGQAAGMVTSGLGYSGDSPVATPHFYRAIASLPCLINSQT